MLRHFIFAGQHDKFFNVKDRLTYPIFIPSKGRADRAYLNLHTLAGLGIPTEGKQLPLVIVVLEKGDVQSYRDLWPHLLILTLPPWDLHRTGVGFSRSVVQRLCEGATLHLSGSKPKFLQFRGAFTLNDLVSGMTELQLLDMHQWKNANVFNAWHGGTTVNKVRVNRLQCFRRAFVHLQDHALTNDVALASFIRDCGPSTTTTAEFSYNSLSLYKVHFLNIRELARLQVFYN